jgi:hypothetical protein
MPQLDPLREASKCWCSLRVACQHTGPEGLEFMTAAPSRKQQCTRCEESGVGMAVFPKGLPGKVCVTASVLS